MNKHIDTLLQKEMTRQDFVKTVGVGVISIFGFSSVLRLLGLTEQHRHSAVTVGYGSTPYGGNKE